ncbi:hypothetical protein FBZ89_12932 [Nitrospirillum amazonense]|uniref:Uncharacterized protein n=1 Tax=Nitrospirillum amazonense TaxID=28077 RepID=A0A560EQI1_9PROT|nr:hypothetical protein FBZ89_12932 [Nitrospirillum amazonense]
MEWAIPADLVDALEFSEMEFGEIRRGNRAAAGRSSVVYSRRRPKGDPRRTVRRPSLGSPVPGTLIDQWNWSVSVESFMAVVLLVPPVIAMDTASK